VSVPAPGPALPWQPYPAPPWPGPVPAPLSPSYPVLPPRPRRSWLGPVLAPLLLTAALVSAAGAATTAAALAGTHGAARPAVFVDQMRPQVRSAALQQLLDRRAAAVRARDRAAFLADVDRADPAFVSAQEQEYENLVRLPLTQLAYRLEDKQYDELVAPRLRERYHAMYRAAAVDLLYRIEGVDAAPLAIPWVPIFGLVDGRWRLAGEAADRSLPLGTNGQPWDAGAIAVVRSARVVAIVSAGDEGRAGELLRMSEAALDRVAAVRPNGWAGRIVVTAVQDRRIFDTYFAGSPDRVNDVAAIAVPYYDVVPSWHYEAAFAATRVVFNPQELGAQNAELGHDLVHEFTHAAMGPVTGASTPTWLVEGFAEYVAYRAEQVPPTWLHRVLAGVATPDRMPDDDTFYGEARNYVTAWLACRLIAQKYGQGRLVALYEAFQHSSGSAEAFRQVLGVEESAFVTQWQRYVQQARSSRLP
jgi:hypothetical protein